MFKGISARKIFQEFPLLKVQVRTNNFWARRYDAKQIPKEKLGKVIQYIRNQRKDLCIL